jgi:hypothetical protein
MSTKWKSVLCHDPMPPLQTWPDPALTYIAQRDLLEEPLGPIEDLWELPQARRLVKRQRADGFWRFLCKPDQPAPQANYNLLET